MRKKREGRREARLRVGLLVKKNPAADEGERKKKRKSNHSIWLRKGTCVQRFSRQRGTSLIRKEKSSE